MDHQQPRRSYVDPLQLPEVRSEHLPTLTGDRRAGVRFCAGCGGSLETGLVIRSYWAYCSYECAIRTEREDSQQDGS
jgi:hypothetical protein